MQLVPTASQTVGPFFHLGFAWLFQPEFAPPGLAGERVSVTGRVLDGDGQPVPDATLEIWQADPEGRYPPPEGRRGGQVHPRFRGFGRVPTDAAGVFRFATVKPGRVPGPAGRTQAPHFDVSVFMRGLNRHLVTRMYFPDDPANAQDPILALVDPTRRPTLIAHSSRGAPALLEWDVVLQGDGETVFFDL
jgi:protocatechuate 3,4-dioxygenase alpha subunit